MNFTLKAGLASAALAVAACFGAAHAADLGYSSRGSIKDGYAPVAPVYGAAPSAAGPCYFRADTGYSWSRDPDATWVGNFDPNVYNATLGNGSFIEAGLGCSMGSRGLRAEMVLGTRQSRDFHGDVNVFAVGDPPMVTNVKSYTMMFNVYHDFGKFGGFVPYVGAGAGWAYHKMDDVKVADWAMPGTIYGEDKVSFAWSLMAGVGYQLTDRAILDVGYRYIDMGMARSSNADNLFAWNPRLEIDDQRAHEIKIGIRYHFGSDCCAQTAYAPMK